jgi:hypothetical protein
MTSRRSELQRLKCQAQKNPAEDQGVLVYHADVLSAHILTIIAVQILNSSAGCLGRRCAMLKLLRSARRGYIDVAVLVLCVMLVIAVAVSSCRCS